MRSDLWPLKIVAGGAAVLIAAGDLTFPGEPTSPGVLMFVGILFVAEAISESRKGQ